MKIAIQARSETHVQFEVSESEPMIANAIRRTLIADVPKMAIEDVEFHLGPIRSEDGKEYESIAPLFDEVIAHRLGLVPLPTDLDLYNPKATCKTCGGEGCTSCTIIYSLNKRGPATVYSGDMEPIGDPKLKPVDPKIPLVQLGDGQAMLVYATAVLGTGREHAKWQPTAAVGYRYRPQVEIDNKKMDAKKFPVEVCPVDILHNEDGKIVVRDEEKCTLCNACVEFARKQGWEGAFKVRGDATRLLLSFETDGSVTAGRALEEALTILEKRFADIAGKAEELA
jgi:DNA-directed RNA polymerase subunit D